VLAESLRWRSRFDTVVVMVGVVGRRGWLLGGVGVEGNNGGVHAGRLEEEVQWDCWISS